MTNIKGTLLCGELSRNITYVIRFSTIERSGEKQQNYKLNLIQKRFQPQGNNSNNKDSNNDSNTYMFVIMW